MLFHCTAGQDRTGITAYLLLRILGVSRKDATDDYLASNTYNAAVHAGYISWYESMGYSHDESVAGIVLQKDFIETTVDQLTEVYGSFDNVVEYGLGLSDSEVEQLRDAYVASRG